MRVGPAVDSVVTAVRTAPATTLRRAAWHSSIEEAELLFCRLTMPGFLRLLTNRQVMGGSTVTISEALSLYDQGTRDHGWNLLPIIDRNGEAFPATLALHATEPATKAATQ